MTKIISIAVLLIFGRYIGNAQEFIRYDSQKGLSGTDVTAMCEDNGYLWIGTNDGLNRFDGKTFKVFSANSKSVNSLSSNNIETLMKDSRGLIWIGLKNGGVDIYNPETNYFSHIKEVAPQYPDRVVSILEDSFGSIWLGSWQQGLYKLTPEKKGKYKYSVTVHYPNNIVSSLLEKPKGMLWIGTYYGYFLYDIKHQKNIAVPVNRYAVTQFLDMPGNQLYFSTWNDGVGKVRWEGKMMNIQEVKGYSSIESIYRFLPYHADDFLMGTWGNGMRIGSYDFRPSTGLPFDIPVVMSFYRDSYNRLWIGSYGKGLYCVENHYRGIKFIPSHQIDGSAIYSVLNMDAGRTLIGTQGQGLYVYDHASNKFTAVSDNGNKASFRKYILSLYADDNVVIVGDDDMGLLYAASHGYSSIKGYKRFQYNKNFGKVTAVYRSPDSSVYWVGTKQFGLYSLNYDKESNSFSNPVHYGSFGNNEITDFVAAPNNCMWISCYDGVFLFNPQGGKVQKVASEGSLNVNCMVPEEGSYKIWLGTSAGLRLLDYSKGRPEILVPSFSKMLPVGNLRNLLLSNGNLWCTIGNRLFVYSINNKELKEINLDNYPPNLFYSCSLMGDGQIMLGGTDGMLMVAPRKLLTQVDHSKIVLSQLQIDNRNIDVDTEVYGRKILSKAIEYTKSITMSYLSKWISLTFAEVGANTYHGNYQYKIEGFSEKWQFLDLSQPLTFSQLPPGHYRLCIQSTSPADLETKGYLYQLEIIITPPWWKTTTFMVFALLLMVAVLVVVYFMIRRNYRKRQQIHFARLEKAKKEEILREKDSFLSGLSHDLLTSCSLILAPVKDLLRDATVTHEQKEKLSIVSKNADYLSELFTTIRDYRLTELGDDKEDKRLVDLIPHIKMAIDAFGYLAKKSNVELRYNSNVEHLHVMIDIVKLERILYNVISNAVKYSFVGGQVETSVQYSELLQHVIIKVQDTGKGIGKQEQSLIFQKYYRVNENSNGLGLGLYTTRKFVELMKGTIQVESEVNKGTTFLINIPVEVQSLIPIDAKADSESDDFMVLLVEDNIQLRDYLEKKISEHFNVTVASDGLEAMSLVKRYLPELVISDVVMPGMDGLSLCREIKQSPLYADIFVILLTAKTLGEDETHGYEAGADVYMKKPFDPDMLIHQLKNVYATLQQRRARIVSEMAVEKDIPQSINAKDAFLTQSYLVIAEHIDDDKFGVDDFSAAMGLSKAVLHRKFKLLLNETPNSFIRTVRLKKAAQLLTETTLSISEIAYMVGFSQAHYFIKCFKDMYGDTPKLYRINNVPNY